MKVSKLTAYVDRKNAWTSIYGGKQLSLQNSADRQKIAYSIDSDFSPENLTYDGEISRYEVQLRQKELHTVLKELFELDPSLN